MKEISNVHFPANGHNTANVSNCVNDVFAG